MTGKAEQDPLVVKSIEFLGGQTAIGGFHPSGELPEIAFAGRSNSGKSSLLNKLVRRKKVARVSRTPGRTREINFFRVNEAFILADLPGYGYARVSKEARSSWRPLIEGYVRRSKALRGVVVLLDVRRDPSEDDTQMIGFLADLEVPILIAVTKVDKLSALQTSKRVAAIEKWLGLDPDQVVPFSSVTGQGRNDLATAVMSLVVQPARGL